jgi:hypothetical protein
MLLCLGKNQLFSLKIGNFARIWRFLLRQSYGPVIGGTSAFVSSAQGRRAGARLNSYLLANRKIVKRQHGCGDVTHLSHDGSLKNSETESCTDRYHSQFKNKCFTEMCNGSLLRLIDFCITQLLA